MPRIIPRDFVNSLRFGGSTVVRATTVSGLDTGCTFAAWFTTSSTDANPRNIVENSLATDKRLVMMRNGATIRAGFFNGTAYTTKSSVDILPNRWYSSIFTWDGTATQLYINSVAQVGTQTPAASAGGTFAIGARGDATTQTWIGNIARVMIFNRAITADEATAFYSAGTVPSGLVRRYDLNEGTGTTATDTSGTGVNGTITSGTWSTDVPMKLRTEASGRTDILGLRQPISSRV